jgi:hypothetical protein
MPRCGATAHANQFVQTDLLRSAVFRLRIDPKTADLHEMQEVCATPSQFHQSCNQ